LRGGFLRVVDVLTDNLAHLPRNAVFRRAGVLRVNTLDELFGMAEVLGKKPRPSGSRLAIVTNGWGPGVLATEALIEDNGSLADLSDETIQILDNFLLPFWSRSNPVDLVGDAKADQYAAAVEALIKDPNNDGRAIEIADIDASETNLCLLDGWWCSGQKLSRS
jgi:acetyltransferase